MGELLSKEKIDCFGILPVEALSVINPRLMPEWVRSAVILAVPYDTGDRYGDGVSVYAHIMDYHLYFKELYARIIPTLEKAFPGKQFFGSADHSPIHEKEAAAKAGLGVIGMHSMLINSVYGSYLFLGSILSDIVTEETAKEVCYCDRCGECLKACPGNAIGEGGFCYDRCLSALSQKKRLSDNEKSLLKSAHIAWGCDICQEACPYNVQRTFSQIPFFVESRHGDFSASEIASMSDEHFSNFAFSWRGRDRIHENLSNLENLGE